jgi:hypothetical protein
VLLFWVLGVAYGQARRRGRRIGLALFFLGAAMLLFVAAAFFPQPPLTSRIAYLFTIASVVSLGLGVAVVLWRGFAR